MRNFGTNKQKERLPRDLETMSLAACLNRIMIKVGNENYNNQTVEALKDDLAYVGEKFGICSEAAAMLSYVLEKSSDFCHRIVLFGRDICTARAPKCAECPLAFFCEEINKG